MANDTGGPWRPDAPAYRDEEQAADAGELPLPRVQLKNLFDYIDAGLESGGCDHTFRHAQAFLRENAMEEQPVLTWLRGQGASCDCEVASRVTERWHEVTDSI